MKRLILSEFCANSGYHRKYAVRLLNEPPSGQARQRARRSDISDLKPQMTVPLADIAVLITSHPQISYTHAVLAYDPPMAFEALPRAGSRGTTLAAAGLLIHGTLISPQHGNRAVLPLSTLRELN